MPIVNEQQNMTLSFQLNYFSEWPIVIVNNKTSSVNQHNHCNATLHFYLLRLLIYRKAKKNCYARLQLNNAHVYTPDLSHLHLLFVSIGEESGKDLSCHGSWFFPLCSSFTVTFCAHWMTFGKRFSVVVKQLMRTTSHSMEE